MTLKELEREINKIRGRSLVVLARTPDGQEREMSVQECAETGSTFIHVVSGNSLDDLDTLLAYELRGVDCAID